MLWYIPFYELIFAKSVKNRNWRANIKLLSLIINFFIKKDIKQRYRCVFILSKTIPKI